jgi:hypothetical protein
LIVARPSAEKLESFVASAAPIEVRPALRGDVPPPGNPRPTETSDRRGRRFASEIVAPQATDLLLAALGGEERRFDRHWRNDDADCRPTDRAADDALVDSAIDALDFETGPAWNKILRWRRS